MFVDPIVLLQVLTGLGLLAHGIPKISDLARTAKSFIKMGYSSAIGIATAIIETIGAAFMILGIAPRFMAGLICLTMLGAMFHHWKHKEPFQDGWETAYLYFMSCLVIVLAGKGWL